MDRVVVTAAKRTPFGRFGGSYTGVSAVELGSIALKQVLADVPQVTFEDINDVYLGLCLPGSGLSPARQAVLAAGWPVQTNTVTVERACCSALTAIGLSYRQISSGVAKTMIAGGMENMSRTPYLLPQVRWGQRLGDFIVEDDLVIRNPYVGAPMARYVGELSLEKGVSRQEQDEWALRSQQLCADAQEAGRFNDELVNVTVSDKKGQRAVERDEHPRANTTLEKLAKLETVYGSPTVTAGNASGLADGAAAVMLTSERIANEQNMPILGTILGHTMVCGEPRESAALPGVAIKKILNELNLSLDDMKLIEINEAFASMPLISSLVLSDYDRPKAEVIRKRINVNGGAIAIGHPLGATGARVLMHMMYELRRRGGGYGVVAICGAMGQADAAVVAV